MSQRIGGHANCGCPLLSDAAGGHYAGCPYHPASVAHRQEERQARFAEMGAALDRMTAALAQEKHLTGPADRAVSQAALRLQEARFWLEEAAGREE